MEPSIIGYLHMLQRYCQFALALIAMIALAMLVVGIPSARAQISLMVSSTTRVAPAIDRL